MIAMAQANFYCVRYQYEDRYRNAGTPMTTARFLYAYTAEDAHYQVGVYVKGLNPDDPYFKILEIEPAQYPNQEAS